MKYGLMLEGGLELQVQTIINTVLYQHNTVQPVTLKCQITEDFKLWKCWYINKVTEVSD